MRFRELAGLLRLRLPSLEALDRLASRVVLFGLALLSVGIVTGLTQLENLAITAKQIVMSKASITVVFIRSRSRIDSDSMRESARRPFGIVTRARSRVRIRVERRPMLSTVPSVVPAWQ